MIRRTYTRRLSLILLSMVCVIFCLSAQDFVPELEEDRLRRADTSKETRGMSINDPRQYNEDGSRKRRLYEFEAPKPFANFQEVASDTSIQDFQIYNPIFKESIGNTWNGNLGSPYESQLFSKRVYQSEFIFMQPFNAYIVYPEHHHFLNTRTPYINFSYNNGGPSDTNEEYVNVRLSRNVTSKINVDLGFRQYYGRGLYQHQATNHLSYRVAANYLGDRYKAYTLFFRNRMRNQENAGITNDDFIDDPEVTGVAITEPNQIPVNVLNGQNDIRNEVVYFGHTFDLINKTVKRDSLGAEKVPFLTLSHTLNLELNYRKFFTNDDYFTDSAGLALTPMISEEETIDNTNYRKFQNTLGAFINEEVNSWGKFGIGAYADIESRSYYLTDSITDATTGLALPDTTQLNKTGESSFAIGGRIEKRLGKTVNYFADLKQYILGDYSGDIEFSSAITLKTRVLSTLAEIKIGAEFESSTPNFLHEHYYSNFYTWDNNFSKEERTTLRASLSFPESDVSLYVNAINMQNHIYWGEDATPQQKDGGISVLELGVKGKINFGKFHLAGEIVTQTSSDKAVLSLPSVVTYANLYYRNLLFDVLDVSVGAEGRYFTDYYASAYSPILGRYHNQREEEVGSFPVISPYAKFHLKRFNFFVKWYHFNETFQDSHYFTQPHYPLNPNMIKYGFSWNFYS